jgi:FkbM family methyltransferase
MFLRSEGQRYCGRIERSFFRVAAAARSGLVLKIRVRDKDFISIYASENVLDANRALSLWIKEEGTMSWIAREVQPGDVFMDIGANIGIYTIAAAHRTGTSGQVYAFEPHKINSVSLLRNVTLNDMADRVQVFSMALTDVPKVQRFNYASLDSASTASQLGHARIAGSDASFVPVANEVVLATTVDQLIEDSTILPPDMVKIDVDGNELEILHGMRSLLVGPKRPRSLQVEINVGEESQIVRFLTECEYGLAERHFTHIGKQESAAGQPLEKIAHNAIFRPAENSR